MPRWSSIRRPASVERIDTGKAAHWLAISHAADKVFASCKTSDFVAVIDRKTRSDRPPADPRSRRGARCQPGWRHAVRLRAPHADALCIRHCKPKACATPSRSQAARAGRTNSSACVSRPTAALSACRRCSTITPRSSTQLRCSRLRRSPRKRHRWDSASRRRAHAYLCCHDDAMVLEFALATGRVTRQFPTASGCEYVIAY